tara:strand:- start:21478 stop:22461 length:984 start_codon:yes stop_codon:yes gene_type:complete
MANNNILKNYAFNNKRDALYESQRLKCRGVHKLGLSFYPCPTKEELIERIHQPRYDVLSPSTFETIDRALFDWVNAKLDVRATTNKGWKKVPVVWMTERAFQIKDDKDLRSQKSEALIFPMVAIERTTVSKTPSAKRPIPAQVFKSADGTALVLSKKIKQSKTRNFANAGALRLYKQNTFKYDNKKVVYEYSVVPLPIYHDITYNIRLRTEYQQQMNEILSPFLVYSNNVNQFMISYDGHAYEAFLNPRYGIRNNVSSMANNERVYESTLRINVLGYLMGAPDNQDGPRVAKYENAVEIKFPRERVIFGDINEFGIVNRSEKDPYRP